MSKESIEELIKAEAQKLVEAQGGTLPVPEDENCSIYQVGAKLFIRTVTNYYVGQVCFVSDDEIGMVGASWVADTGRFSEAMASGTLSEVEMYKGRISVGRGAICDVSRWGHALPTETK